VRDPLPVPAEQRVGRHEGGDLAQRPTAHSEGAHREPSPVVIGQAQTPPAQLPPQEAILFEQVRECLPLSALEPAGQDHQQHVECSGVDHEPEVISRHECAPFTTGRPSRGTVRAQVSWAGFGLPGQRAIF
jgi:hypothetical protein